MFKRIWAAVMAILNPPELGRTFSARIVNVKDGDSLEFVAGYRRYSGRLVGVDAPEYTQAFGAEASRQLIKLAYASRDVRVEKVGYDKFNRMLVRVTVGSVDLAHAMLESGLAWHIAAYTKESIPEHSQKYAKAALEAREARRGLWSQPNPMPPGQYRATLRGTVRPKKKPKKSSGQRDLFTGRGW